jgi:hypothetical protein
LTSTLDFLQNPNMKTSGLLLRNSIQCLFALIPLLLASFWFSARVQAVSPSPDGAYTGANTAEGGSGALFSLTTGSNNTALGSQALYKVTTGIQNTATGAQALMNNTANGNTANGFQALVKNTTGSSNTGAGWRTLFENTIGEMNTATGDSALYSNTTGINNTALGFGALRTTTGNSNTALGSTVEKLQSMVAELTRRLEEQDSKIQKMSDQLGTSKPVPHLAANR